MDVGKIGQGGPTSIDFGNKGDRVLSIKSNKPVEEVKEVSKGEKSGQDNPSKEEVAKAVDKLNKILQDENVHAEYEVHDKLKDVMIRIINNDTKEVVLEIPPKKILDMVAKMMEMVGVLLDEKA